MVIAAVALASSTSSLAATSCTNWGPYLLAQPRREVSNRGRSVGRVGLVREDHADGVLHGGPDGVGVGGQATPQLTQVGGRMPYAEPFGCPGSAAGFDSSMYAPDGATPNLTGSRHRGLG